MEWRLVIRSRFQPLIYKSKLPPRLKHLYVHHSCNTKGAYDGSRSSNERGVVVLFRTRMTV